MRGDIAVKQTRVTGFGDNWRGYFVYLGGPVQICYDATVKHLSGHIRKQYPDTLVVEIPNTEENENEDQPNQEMERIFNISENLLCGKYDVRMIGVMVNPDCSSIVFCCNIKEKKVIKLINTLFKRIDVNRLRHLFLQDDNFGYYNTLLSPPHYEDNCIKNRVHCDRLTENGEAFKKPREIDFYCRFSDAQHIQRIVDKLADDFMENEFREVERKKEEDGKYCLWFTVQGIPSLIWIHEITCWIIYSLKETNGYFDGWGCLVVKDGDA